RVYPWVSIRQLSSGGYIACGGDGTGTLFRYEPETGIEENQGEIVSSLSAPSPNPFSSSLNIHFNLNQTSVIELSVYDLSGRLIEILEQDSFQEGEHSFDWTPGNLSSGCYLIRLSTQKESFVRNCIFLQE
ncbi:MAG: T9SS type A sorting domain-containing protein, partial [Candidatus Sabulitectum sp.]|nr:T9SS type A sorting domain-containing protein [Candidatus Sabulitectum sp.]